MTSADGRTDRARILTAVTGTLMRRGIRNLIESDERLSVAGEAGDVSDVPKAYLYLMPDAIILGMAQPGDGGPADPEAPEIIRTVPRAGHGTPVIVLLHDGTSEALLDAIEAGAKGVLMQDSPGDELVSAIHTVLAGGHALDPCITGAVFQHMASAQSLGEMADELRNQISAFRISTNGNGHQTTEEAELAA